MRTILLVISVSLALAPALTNAAGKKATVAQQQQVQDVGISQSRYVTGGVVGSVAGFGIGHAIQKRYAKSHAWIFTAGEALAVTYIFASGLFACDGLTGSELDSCSNRVHQKFVAGSLVYWGFHIWEIVDVWTGVNVREHEISLGPAMFGAKSPGLALAYRF